MTTTMTYQMQRVLRAPLEALHVCWVQLRVAWLHELQYRAHLVLQLVYTTTSVASALIGLGVVFAHAPTLAGWTHDQLLVVVGLHLIVGGMIGAVVQPGLKLLMEQVRLGTLDYTLIKPRDAQLLSSTQKIDPFKFVDVAAGIAVVVTGLVRSSSDLGAGQVALFGLVAMCGAACVYHAWVLLSTVTFWFIRTGELLDIARSSFDSGRWPTSMYGGMLKHLLTFVVPVGIAVTMPADVLVHGGGHMAGTIALTVAFTIVMGVVARAVWTIALRSYAGASA